MSDSEDAPQSSDFEKYVADRLMVLEGAANFVRRHNLSDDIDDIITVAIFLAGDAVEETRLVSRIVSALDDDDDD